VVVCPLLFEPLVTGGQKRTLRLLEAMERAGLRPHLLTADAGAPGAAEALRARGWAVEVIEHPPPTFTERLRQHAARRPSPFLRRLGAQVARLGRDAALVQVEHTQSAYYPAPDGVPWVLSLHNLDSAVALSVARQRRPLGKSWLQAHNRAAALRSVERRVLPRADHVLCVSPGDAAAVRAAGGRPLLAPNGVDDAFFAVGAGGGERALFFGHFGYAANRRGLERFVREGWPATLAHRPGARLAVAGGGLDDALRARLAAAPGVEVLGLVDDLPDALAAARAVVVPIWEGGGTRLKVLEALAAGRPVVSTPLGAEGIGFVDGRHGRLADAPAALADEAAAVLADPGLAATLARGGRELAERFRWSAVTAPAQALYARWVSSCAPRRR
jgi:glycosyltransferase involved in cell wall biosynthesis